MKNDLYNTAKALCAKLDIIHNDTAYKGIWLCAHVHGMKYDGPTYTDELAALKNALLSNNPKCTCWRCMGLTEDPYPEDDET